MGEVVDGDSGKGEEEETEDGECDKGVLASEMALAGRCICDGGRGIGTGVGRELCVCWGLGLMRKDVDGKEVDDARRWVG